MYDPSIGRWLEEDPIWPTDHINPYVYVDNTPTNFTDPSGLLGKGIYNRRTRGDESAWVFFTGDFVTRPEQHKGKVEVEAGFFTWDIKVSATPGRLDVEFGFEPKGGCKSKAISFIQVVHEWKVEGRPYYSSDYKKKFSTNLQTGNGLDHDSNDDDPYYGAKWKNKQWIFERPGTEVGSRETGLSARMTDHPGLKANKRTGESLLMQFETAAFAIDSQEVLCVLKWGFEIPKDNRAPIHLLGGSSGDVDVFVTPEFSKLMRKANSSDDMKHKVTRPDRTIINCGDTSIFLGND